MPAGIAWSDAAEDGAFELVAFSCWWIPGLVEHLPSLTGQDRASRRGAGLADGICASQSYGLIHGRVKDRRLPSSSVFPVAVLPRLNPLTAIR